jgi:type II secretory pathway pseudopilin PulG
MATAPQLRSKSSRPRRGEEGYFLLSLMLVVALMVIAAAVAASTMAFEIKRDREQELIHRGVQYTRAIQAYYKKFGRYPTRLEDLDNTNNLRYLRKHYKDPVNKNLDFKLLHYGDPGVSMSGGLGGAGIAGANTVGQMNAAAAGNSAFGGGSPGGSAFGQSSGFGGSSNSSFGNSSGGFGGSSGGFGGSSGSAFGGNSNSAFGGSTNNSTGSGGPNSTAATPTDTSTSPAGSTDSQPSGPATPGTTVGDTNPTGQQVFGGGPIVGVSSASKETTIREFNKKKKYNEWQFVYDPTADRGGLIRTPYQPSLQVGGQNLNGQNGQSGQPGSNGTSNSPFGNTGSSFGQQSGFGNNNNSSFGGGSSPPAPSTPQSPQ